MKTLQKLPQTFAIFLHLKSPGSPGRKPLTEAAVRKWIKDRLADCELGEIVFGDVVESPYKS